MAELAGLVDRRTLHQSDYPARVRARVEQHAHDVGASFAGCVAKNEEGDKLRNSWSRFKPLHDQVQPIQVAAQPSAQIILRCVRWYLT